ncbi:hypothetical protein [Paludisphaera sp.]|uniref:hypothetical protein n=1 Tax=Paludisphaera sp. TaxID=2017432 RepID=UPI00301BC693
MEVGIWASSGLQRLRIRPPQGAPEPAPPPARQFGTWLQVKPARDRTSGFTLEINTGSGEMRREFWWQAADRASVVYLPADRFWRDTVLAYLARTESEELERLLPALTLDPDSSPDAQERVRMAIRETISRFRASAPSDPAYDAQLVGLERELGEPLSAGTPANPSGGTARETVRRLQSVLLCEPTEESDRAVRSGFLYLREFEWPPGQNWVNFRLNDPARAEAAELRVAVNLDRWPPGCAFSVLSGTSSPLPRDGARPVADRSFYGSLTAVPGAAGRWAFTVARREATRSQARGAVGPVARLRFIFHELNRVLHRCRERQAGQRSTRFRVKELLVARGVDWGWADANICYQALAGDPELIPELLRPEPGTLELSVCEDPLIAAATYLLPRVASGENRGKPFAVVDLGGANTSVGAFEATEEFVRHRGTDLVPVGEPELTRRARALVLDAVLAQANLRQNGGRDPDVSAHVRGWTARTTERLLRQGDTAVSVFDLLGRSAGRGVVARHFGRMPALPVSVPTLALNPAAADDVQADRLRVLRGGYQPHRPAGRPAGRPAAIAPFNLGPETVLTRLPLLRRDNGDGLDMGAWVRGLTGRALAGVGTVFLIGAAANRPALFRLLGPNGDVVAAEWAAELSLLDDQRAAAGFSRNLRWVAAEANDDQRRPELLATDWPDVWRAAPAAVGPAGAGSARTPLADRLLSRASILEARLNLFANGVPDDLSRAFRNPLSHDAFSRWRPLGEDPASGWLVDPDGVQQLIAGCRNGSIPWFEHTFSHEGAVYFGTCTSHDAAEAVGPLLCTVTPAGDVRLPLTVRFVVPWPGLVVPVPSAGDGDEAAEASHLFTALQVQWHGPVVGGGPR